MLSIYFHAGSKNYLFFFAQSKSTLSGKDSRYMHKDVGCKNWAYCYIVRTNVGIWKPKHNAMYSVLPGKKFFIDLMVKYWKTSVFLLMFRFELTLFNLLNLCHREFSLYVLQDAIPNHFSFKFFFFTREHKYGKVRIWAIMSYEMTGFSEELWAIHLLLVMIYK